MNEEETSRVTKLGGVSPQTSELRQPHDRIDFFIFQPERIVAVAPDLLRQGRSLRDVSRVLGIPKSTVIEALKVQGVAINVKPESGNNPPYGYALLNKKLVVNPTEYKTVQLILDLNKIGKSKREIAATLNRDGQLSRKGRWHHTSIGKVIARHSG